MTTAKKRPRRSNSPLDIVRGIKTLKTIYQTTARLRKLLPGVYSTARQEHFARAVAALRSWPERTTAEILAAGHEIEPTWRPLERKWCLPRSIVTSMQEYADRAPDEGIDTEKLREILKDMDQRTRERFMELVVEEIGIPVSKKEPRIDARLYRKVVRGHNWLMDAIRRDPNPNLRAIDISQKAAIPKLWENRTLGG